MVVGMTLVGVHKFRCMHLGPLRYQFANHCDETHSWGMPAWKDGRPLYNDMWHVCILHRDSKIHIQPYPIYISVVMFITHHIISIEAFSYSWDQSYDFFRCFVFKVFTSLCECLCHDPLFLPDE